MKLLYESIILTVPRSFTLLYKNAFVCLTSFKIAHLKLSLVCCTITRDEDPTLFSTDSDPTPDST